MNLKVQAMTPEIKALYDAALARFEGHNEPGRTLVRFLHHGVAVEPLLDPIERRLRYIVEQKPAAELATRLAWIAPAIAYPEMAEIDAERERAVADWQRAYADWQRAEAARKRSYAEWERASAERELAEAERVRAVAERQRSYAEWERASAERELADADWQRADAECTRANADWERQYMEIFLRENPTCPWNGRTLVFPEKSKS